MVEIRGVEPLTFSMPLSADDMTREGGMRQSRIFIDSFRFVDFRHFQDHVRLL